MTEPDFESEPYKTAFSMYPEIDAMYREFPNYPEVILPSKYWQKLNQKNLQQLADSRYENFKRTLARNYFTWIVNPWNRQMRILMREAGIWESLKILAGAISSPRHELLKRRHSIYYDLLTNLLWRYVEKNDTDGNLSRLVEPLEGNPLHVTRDGRLISQDLANSLLEYQAIMHPNVDASKIATVLELGPGYGRTAYVFLKLLPNCRYVLVDIPPALFVAQRYLSEVFEDRKIFGFQVFDDFESVRVDFEQADIIFLAPNQLELLPDDSVDLFVNISSLHEMHMGQIRYYFNQIDRLTRRYFYFKQWKKTIVPFEEESINEADYPIPDDWTLINRQQCEVQAKFFEAIYQLPKG